MSAILAKFSALPAKDPLLGVSGLPFEPASPAPPLGRSSARGKAALSSVIADLNKALINPLEIAVMAQAFAESGNNPANGTADPTYYAGLLQKLTTIVAGLSADEFIIRKPGAQDSLTSPKTGLLCPAVLVESDTSGGKPVILYDPGLSAQNLTLAVYTEIGNYLADRLMADKVDVSSGSMGERFAILADNSTPFAVSSLNDPGFKGDFTNGVNQHTDNVKIVLNGKTVTAEDLSGWTIAGLIVGAVVVVAAVVAITILCAPAAAAIVGEGLVAGEIELTGAGAIAEADEAAAAAAEAEVLVAEDGETVAQSVSTEIHAADAGLGPTFGSVESLGGAEDLLIDDVADPALGAQIGGAETLGQTSTVGLSDIAAVFQEVGKFADEVAVSVAHLGEAAAPNVPAAQAALLQAESSFSMALIEAFAALGARAGATAIASVAVEHEIDADIHAIHVAINDAIAREEANMNELLAHAGLAADEDHLDTWLIGARKASNQIINLGYSMSQIDVEEESANSLDHLMAQIGRAERAKNTVASIENLFTQLHIGTRTIHNIRTALLDAQQSVMNEYLSLIHSFKTIVSQMFSKEMANEWDTAGMTWGSEPVVFFEQIASTAAHISNDWKTASQDQNSGATGISRWTISFDQLHDIAHMTMAYNEPFTLTQGTVQLSPRIPTIATPHFDQMTFADFQQAFDNPAIHVYGWGNSQGVFSTTFGLAPPGNPT